MAIPAFALHDLGWQAFQQLCHTVLREVHGQEVQAFLDSRDGGRDGAFTGTWRTGPNTSLVGRFVVQCKHSAKPGATLTPRDLDDEFTKAERLVRAGRCDSYLLITNCGVTGESELAIERELQERGVKACLVLGATWLNQTIASCPRLRRLVPRLYGLGDLTQILDSRRYSQARAVLDAMRMDLNKFVLTQTYHRALEVVGRCGFVMLVGAPAMGKTTIAAQLALGAADEFDIAIVKLESVAQVSESWNPDERQLFWIDDAFGPTQFDRELARDWVLAVPKIQSAIKRGAQFVVTSRDYVYRAARDYLKPGSFPLMDSAQVVVNVEDVTLDERRLILYSHLRHGAQPNSFLSHLHPHLEGFASHPGFTPESARRIADPIFTSKLAPWSRESVDLFASKPQAFLKDVMAGLGSDARAALALIFESRDWLPSPVTLTDQYTDLVSRLGSSLGGVVGSLEALRGSLVEHVVRHNQSGWIFSHPTMVDAFAELVSSPEFLVHFVAGCPIATLMRRVTCGDVGIQGALVVPRQLYAAMLERLDEPLPTGEDLWFARTHRFGFLASRCDREFLEAWLRRNPDRLMQLEHPALMLTHCAENELVARLYQVGLLPEAHRATFAEGLVDYCLDGTDFSVLWSESLRALLTAKELERLRDRVRNELLSDLDGDIWNCARDGDDESAIQPLEELVGHLPALFPEDPAVRGIASDLREMIATWMSSREMDAPMSRPRGPAPGGVSRQFGADGRSVFDDLLVGRPDGSGPSDRAE